jgi:hypothetical protein
VRAEQTDTNRRVAGAELLGETDSDDEGSDGDEEVNVITPQLSSMPS